MSYLQYIPRNAAEHMTTSSGSLSKAAPPGTNILRVCSLHSDECICSRCHTSLCGKACFDIDGRCTKCSCRPTEEMPHPDARDYDLLHVVAKRPGKRGARATQEHTGRAAWRARRA